MKMNMKTTEFNNGENIVFSRLQKTAGFKKQINYFEALLKADSCAHIIDNIRKKFQIPKNGFPEYKFKRENFFEDWLISLDKGHGEFVGIFYDDVCDIQEKFNISDEWTPILINYIFSGKVVVKPEEPLVGSFGMARISDKNDGNYGNYTDVARDPYPVVMGISPYASKRDLLDFISKTYKILIKPLQAKFANKNIKLGKIKTRRNKERNDFIYQNRHLPLKRIRKLLANQKIFLDDGHISKIISLETKGRKEL